MIDYCAATGGARRTSTLATYGRQPGDPLRAAAAVADAVESAEPPLRLLPGKAAYDLATARPGTLRDTFGTWRDVILCADFPAT